MKLGDVVTITNRLVRTCGKAEWKDNVAKQPKEWMRVDTVHESAIFLGWRHLSNGHIEYTAYMEEPATFVRQSTIKAALVCASETQNPFYTIIDNGDI